MDAVILFNKPSGITSFAAVRKCRNLFHEKKAGHTGTLDPEASGLMIILLGKYTKLASYCVKDHKRYHAHFSLGKSTDTEDIWGTVLEEREPHDHTEEELAMAAKHFTGRIMQIPPMYSAIKKDGKKLYEYARKGEVVERAQREVFVNSLKVRNLGDNQYVMDAEVSSGTYIRTLIKDYAASLHELGCMTSLVRTGIENLSLSEAAGFTELEEGKGFADPIQVIDPKWQIVECHQVKDILNGKRIVLKDVRDHVILVNAGKILAAYERNEDGLYHCVRGLF